MARDDPLTIRMQLLELDIDLRLGVGLFEAVASSAGDEALMLGYLRVAYGAGYGDALIDQPRGLLFRDHGFPVPKRKPR